MDLIRLNQFKLNLIKMNQMQNINLESREKMHRKVRKCKYEMSFKLGMIEIVLTIAIILSTGQCIGALDEINQIHRNSNQMINDSINNSYYFEVKENTIENQLIGQVNLINTFNNVIYRLGNTSPEFRFDSLTGKIYTTKYSLDRERQQFYNLIILNNQPTISTNPIQVKIKVLDQNDNKPYWLSNNVNSKQISFSESAPKGTKIILDTAIDQDEDQLHYQLVHCLDNDLEQCYCDHQQLVNSINVNNNDKSDVNSDVISDHLSVHKPIRPFKLNFDQKNSILNLELNERLDRELISSYLCKLCVFDLKNQSNSMNLAIRILDVNDCLPKFTQTNYSTTLNHNLRKGDLILSVQATDNDEPNTANSKLIYYLHNENNLINPNYDNVEDFYINKTTGSIHISHDGLPIHCSHKLDNNQMNNQLNSRILNEQLLNSQSNGLKSACVFTVVCEDQGNPKLQSKAYVTVFLSSTDNLHVPEIKIMYFNHRFAQYAVVDRDETLNTTLYGTAVAAISVSDEDQGINGQTNLEIIAGNELEHFYLDSEFSNAGSYVIRVNHNYTSTNNMKKPNQYNITIRATDYGHMQLSSTQNLVIKVNEITDDHKPVFNQTIYRVELLETAPIDSFICLVNAIDYNQQSIGYYFYSLSGNNSDYFQIDSQTGMVKLAKQLDRELINDLELKVYVRDTHLNEWLAARILINVLDVNDHAPTVILRSSNLKPNYEVIEIDKECIILKIIENNRVNYEFTVVDEDLAENGSVIVELLYDYEGLFYLNTTSYMNRKEKNVHLYSSRELDYESAKNYELLIVLSDQGTPQKSSQFRIEIQVQDQDDQPAFVYPKHYFINFDTNQLENNMIKIRTIDLDKRSPIKFFFNFNHNHKNLNFVSALAMIDEYDGNIVFKKSINLDSFPIKYLPFNVTCDSCDRLNQQATIHLYLKKNLKNDFRSSEHQTIVISELTELRSVIFNFSEKLFKKIDESHQLSIVDGDSQQIFTIQDRNLILIKKLDYDTSKEYNLTICAHSSEEFSLKNLIIKIKNENNHHPQFKQSYVYLELIRNTPYHMSIFKLNAIDSDDLDGDVSSNIVYHFTTNNQLNSQLKNPMNSLQLFNDNEHTNSTLIQYGNYMFRINRDQLELNVNLFDSRIGSNDELVYLYREECIYLVSIQTRDLNLKNDLLSSTMNPIINRRMINIFIKIKNPVLDNNVLFDRNLELIKTFYEVNIEESKPINSKLVKFDLFYHKQLDGQLAFKFLNDEDNLIKNHFGIFPDGTLYLKNKLDREQNENFILQVAVYLISNHQQPINEDKIIRVLIHVRDNNDQMPKFEKEIYHFYVAENSPVNTSIGCVKAIDNDLGLNSLVNYHLISNKFSHLIELDSQIGQIFLKASIDYESIKMITFEIEAEDQAIYEKRLKSKCKVQIQILNVNDCSPCFEVYDSESGNYLCSDKLKQQISIMENLKPNTTIHEFKVKDLDTSNDQLKFTLIESEFSSSFHLNSSTGRLKLVKNLDREINERIELLVKVDDSLNEAFNRFVIKLEDIDDNIAVWNINPNDTIIHIAENTEPGTSLLILNSTDYDSGLNGLIHYEIVSVNSVKIEESEYCNQHKLCEQGECFKIEDNQLILTNYLDYESEREFEINITAVDYYGLRSEILSVRVFVANINDCRPKFKRISSDEETISIFENIKINSVIVEVQAFDCDNEDVLTYELVKCQILGIYHKKCPLELNSKTGNLVTIDTLDYEEIKRINLKIKVTDLNGHTDFKELSIVIENLNDNPPKITTSTSFVVMRQQAIERNEILAQLQAIDGDRDRVIYRIASSTGEQNYDNNQIDSSAVYVDENDGFIYAKNKIDHSIELKFPVILIDENLFTNELITVLILITNNTTSIAETQDLVFDVYENEAIGFLIHKFKCNFFNCKYHLNTCNKLFSVNEQGELRTENNLDRELKSIYYFDLYAVNQYSIQVFKIKINILDRNDNSPKLLGSSGNLIERIVRVKENERLKSTIFDLSSIVTDFDLNTQFQFSILNCTALTLNQTRKQLKPFDYPFLIESNSGKIILIRELDRELNERYQLSFSISDGTFKINDQLVIQISDVNDQIPSFPKTHYSFNVSESVKNRTIIGKIEAKDFDLNGQLKYKIISEQDDSPFKINEKTGNIYLIRPIDYEIDNHLYISVCQASDGEFLSTPVTLFFNVLNSNDNPSLFEQLEYKFIFNDTEQVDSELFCLKARDDDNDKLTYKMHEQDEEYQLFNNLLEEFYFEVNSESGCVKLKKKFEIEKKDHFRFIMSVTDGKHNDYATVQLQVIKNKGITMKRSMKNYRKNLLIKMNANCSIGDTIYAFNENVQLITINDHQSIPFKINSFNELVLTDDKIDTNQLNYHFQLNYNQTTFQNVTININSDPFEPIRFERSQYEVSVYENFNFNKPIIELNLLNFRKNEILNLEIVSGNQNDQFLLNRNQVLLAKPLNYEKIKKFNLKVKVSVLENEAYTNIQINVMNVVDKRPIFLAKPYYFKWCENTVGDLGRLIAKSEYDLQSNSTTSVSNLKYLLKNNEFDYFNLDANTGLLSVIKEIDRENLKSNFIELKVLVIDELNANLQNEVIVTIEIVNLNDNQPRWFKSTYEVILIEQVIYKKGHSLKNLTAFDRDNDTLKYRIVNSDASNSKFSLNQSTGELCVNEEIVFDRIKECEYNLVIEASDGEFKSNCTVRIRIKDVNNHIPKLSTNQFSSNLVRKQLIKENQMKVIIPYQYFSSDSYMTENEQLFLFGLNAEDLDEFNTVNSKINFKMISTADSRKFKLNKDNGLLTIQNLFISSGKFSKLQNSSYKIEVQLSDCSPNNSLENKIQIDLEFYDDLSNLKWMTIFELVLSDIQLSESTSIDSVIYEFKPLKHLNNLTNLISLEIVGGDYDKRFKIVQDANKKFKLVLNKKLDFEYVQNYLIFLEATSFEQNKKRFQILELNINVKNENDNIPQFTQEVYNVTILEEQEPNSFIIQLEAFDLDNQIDASIKNPEVIEEDDFNNENIDSYKQNEFRFEILNTKKSLPFRIEEYSGAVFTTDRIDREQMDNHLFELIVQVQDNGGLKSQAKLVIQISNLNDNPPRFNELFRVNVTENEKIGAFVIQITVNDADNEFNELGKNGSHKFSLNDKRFTIDQYTGKVYLAQKLDCDFGEDELQVVVTVNDEEYRQDTILTVHIIDENDQKPIFQNCRKYFKSSTDKDENCIFHFELDETKNILGRILALDSDKGQNSLVSYQFTSQSDLFDIDKSTGEIYKLENYLKLKQKPSLHKITVKACDNGLLPQCSYAKIYLTRNQNSIFINLPIPIDLMNETIIYKAQGNNLIDSDGFGYCNGTSSSFNFKNQSLLFAGENKLKLGDQFICQFWSLFELQKFTNLRIIVTKRNLFEPQFLTSRITSQLILNETDGSEIKPKQVYQFKATDNDLNDGFNNEITFKMQLIDAKYNSDALQYYFKRFKTNSENENFFSKSIEWLILNNNLTKHYSNPFSLDSKTGFLYLDHGLDFELITSYKYQITISDNALFDQKNSSQLFSIHLNNLDDNKPFFLINNEIKNELNLFIEENNPQNYVLDKLTIIDFDEPNCCSIKNYKILNSSDSDYFELDQSGNLKTLKSFDYETKSNYEITLDHDLRIKVTVIDVEERKPKFIKKSYEFNLLEQTELNTIITNLNDTIEPHKNYEFQLLKPINFGIDLKENNDLIVSDQIDFESFSMNEIYRQTQQDNVPISTIKLKFILLVKSKGEQVANLNDYDRTELLINLIDLNEPPKFEKPVIDCLFVRTNGQCSYQFVNECKVQSFDYDQGDYVRYRLLNQNHLFTIDEHKGIINLVNCNLTSHFMNLPSSDNLILNVESYDSNELQSKAKINIKLNWRTRVIEPSSYTELNQFSYGNNNLTNRELISRWCSKGKQVPESTDRMTCYRKTVDHYCCECKSNYQGMEDCSGEDLCSTTPNDCQNGGLCKQINSREKICLCRKEFRGSRCEKSLTNLCSEEKVSKCGVNGICENVKSFGYRCNCLDQHTHGRECSQFSLGIRPFAYIRLNVSLNEINDELSMTFASFFRINHQQIGEDFGQLMLYNHGQPNMQTGRTDFIALELYEKYLLLRLGGSHQSKFVELKIYANKHDLLDGRYYKFSLIRNRKIAHISIYSCSRIHLDNQLNCNNLLNQSSISYNQPSFHFNSNPLFVGGLDYAYGSNKMFAQKTNGHVLARSNFIGCLYKATMNGIKINEYIAEKSFVDPICRPSLYQSNLLTLNQPSDQNFDSTIDHLNTNQVVKSITNEEQSIVIKKQIDCSIICGKESVYCKQNMFEEKCGCKIQSNQTNVIYESSQSCNGLCEIQLNKKSLVKLKLSEKWNNIIKSQTYRTMKLEEFILRFYPTAYSSSYSNLWTNGYLSLRITSNSTIYIVNEEDQFEQAIRLNGNFKLNQWNTFIIKSTGELYVNEQHNRFNPQLFKSNLKSMIVGGDLVGCISHIIINGHLVLNNNDHFYEFQTENVNGFGCRTMFESTKLSLDAISIGIILIIMFFVILLLVISTSFMLFNNSSKTKTSTPISTLPTMSKHYHASTKTTLSPHSLTQMLGNNSYSTVSQDYYEEPFYYGSDYFQHNEKLASNQFNLSNRSQF